MKTGLDLYQCWLLAAMEERKMKNKRVIEQASSRANLFLLMWCFPFWRTLKLKSWYFLFYSKYVVCLVYCYWCYQYAVSWRTSHGKILWGEAASLRETNNGLKDVSVLLSHILYCSRACFSPGLCSLYSCSNLTGSQWCEGGCVGAIQANISSHCSILRAKGVVTGKSSMYLF